MDGKSLAHLGCALAFVVFSSLCSALAPGLLKLAVEQLETPATYGHILSLTSLLAAYGLTQWLARGFAELRTYEHALGEQKALRRLRRRLFTHVVALPMRFHLQRRTGATVQTLNNGFVGYRLMLQHLIFSVLPACVELPLMGVVLLHFGHAKFAGLLTLSAGLYVLAFMFGVRRMSAPARAAATANMHAGAMMTDGLLNVEAIKAFNGESIAESRYDGTLEKSEHAWCRLYRRKATHGLVLASIMALSLTVSLLLAAREVAAGRMTVGDFILVNAYVLQIVRPLEMLGLAARDITQGVAFVEKMIFLLREDAERGWQEGCSWKREGAPEIHFEEVSFSYRPGRPAISNVSFRVVPGKTTALVGASGAGKSTVARLLLRFFEPDRGRILLDGMPIQNIALYELRGSIAVVPQEPSLFNDTIGANISFGRRGCGQVEIERAARLAGLHDFIGGLPEGYQTLVGERGVKLSGGERQRIAIARAALVRPRILILDEATSALDTQTEREVLQNLSAVAKDVTTLIISHRLSAAKHADEILVFSHGTIVERGRHNRLLVHDGHYRALWLAQLEEAGRVPHERSGIGRS